MKVRIYKCQGGEIVVDVPSNKYQSIGIEKCPHPGRFRGGKEPFELEVIDYEELKTMAVNNEAGSSQFYHENGKIKHDNDRSLLLMSTGEIQGKHRKRIERKIDLELEKENPDSVLLIKLQREKEKIIQLSDKGTYQLALKTLDEDGIQKPKIREKLQKKIDELK